MMIGASMIRACLNHLSLKCKFRRRMLEAEVEEGSPSQARPTMSLIKIKISLARNQRNS